VANGNNVNRHFVVKDLVDHAIIPNTNPPKTIEASQLSAAMRTRVLSQRFYLWKDPTEHIRVEAFQFLSG
jgi:hypothetical protein